MNFSFQSNTDNSFTNDIQITIQVQQRNGKKAWTIVTGLENVPNFESKSFLKTLKKKLACNASQKMKDDILHILFQGRHSEIIKEYIIQKLNVSADNIITKGV